jgi:hypothetical protein
MTLYDPDDVEQIEAYGTKKKISHITSSINEARNKFQMDINAEEQEVGSENITRPMVHYLLQFPKGYKLSSKEIFHLAGDLNQCEIIFLPVKSKTMKHHWDEVKQQSDMTHKTYLAGFAVALKSAGKRAPTGKLAGPTKKVPLASVAAEGMLDDDDDMF